MTDWRRILLGCLLVGAATLSAWAQAPAEEQIVIRHNLTYKSGRDLSVYERTRCKLDLYLPAGKTDFPTIVWFHGGALMGGSKGKAETVAVAKAFARQGVAVAAVNYRLYNRVKYPAYVEDAAAAVAWTVAHIAEHGGSPMNIFVSGHSAGAYLAAMVGMDPRWLRAHGLHTSALAGVIPISGQMLTHFTVRRERGVPDPENTPTLDDAGPVYHARKDAPPILSICGGDDWPARAEENRYCIAVLKARGHTACAYQEFPGRNHGTIISQLGEPEDEVMTAIRAFLEAYHRGPVDDGTR